MVTVSQTLLDMMDTTTNSERPVFRERAKITFSDNKTIELDSAQLSASDNTIADAAGASSFPLGVAVSKSIQLNISNAEDENTGERPFSDFYFYGARIHLWQEAELTDGTTETIEVGWFTVTSPEEYGSTISVTAFDDMYRADQTFDPTVFGTATETTLLNATQLICSKVGIPYSQSSFANCNKTVHTSLFTGSQLTYRQALGYIAMIAGGNARLNRNGNLEIMSYSSVKPSQNGKNTFNGWIDLSMDTEDVSLTGISIAGKIEKSTTNEDGEAETEEVDTVFYNTGYADGYAITLENPLMEGKEQEFLDAIWNVIENISFRKFEGSHIENPLVEFMDGIYVVDRKGNSNYSIVTDVTYTFYGDTNIKNSAESAARVNSSYSNPNTSTEKKFSKMIYAERSARETAIKNLKESFAQAGDGVFTYSAVQSDGSEILYLYNVKSAKEPPYQDSSVIIRISGSALAISHGLKDGGDPTNDEDYDFGSGYNFATDDAVLNVLYANGIDADKINIRNFSLQTIGALIGGRNLIEDSRELSKIVSKSNNSYITLEEAEDGIFKKAVADFTSKAQSEDGKTIYSFVIHSNKFTLPFMARAVTLSFYARNVSGNDSISNDLYVRFNGMRGELSASQSIEIGEIDGDPYVKAHLENEFVRISITLKENSGLLGVGVSGVDHYISIGIANGTKAEIFAPKLEAGSVPTDWSPSPNDAYNSIQNLDVQMNGQNGVAIKAQRAEEAALASIKSNEISLQVANNYSSAQIKLIAKGKEVSNGEIKIKGAVTFNALSTKGQTVITGDNVKTGTIRGSNLILTTSTSYELSNNNLRNSAFAYTKINQYSIESRYFAEKSIYVGKGSKIVHYSKWGAEKLDTIEENVVAGTYNVHPKATIKDGRIIIVKDYVNKDSAETYTAPFLQIDAKHGITLTSNVAKFDPVYPSIRISDKLYRYYTNTYHESGWYANGSVYLPYDVYFPTQGENYKRDYKSLCLDKNGKISFVYALKGKYKQTVVTGVKLKKGKLSVAKKTLYFQNGFYTI